MTPLVLLAVAGLLGLRVAPRLAAASWVLRAPRLGVLAWYSLCAAVVGSVVLAGGSALLHWQGSHGLVGGAWRLCLDALGGAHGAAAQGLAMFGLLVLALVTVRMAFGAYTLAGAVRRTRDRQVTLVRLAGRRLPHLGATMVPSPEPAAYLVPGGHTGVVITSAALQRLSRSELSAVLAHERAHAEGRHYLVVRVAELLRHAFPYAGVFRLAQQHVHRLIELCADEVATRTSRPVTLARALVSMASPVAASTPFAPATVLEMGGGDTVERLHRLLDPPAPLSWPVRLAVMFGCAALPLLPVVITLLDGAAHGAGAPMWLW